MFLLQRPICRMLRVLAQKEAPSLSFPTLSREHGTRMGWTIQVSRGTRHGEDHVCQEEPFIQTIRSNYLSNNSHKSRTRLPPNMSEDDGPSHRREQRQREEPNHQQQPRTPKHRPQRQHKNCQQPLPGWIPAVHLRIVRLSHPAPALLAIVVHTEYEISTA